MLVKRKKANPLLDTSRNIKLTPRQEKIRKIKKNITRFLKKYGRLMVGGSILAVVVFCAIFAPFLTDQDPTLVVLRNSKQLPNAEHLLGCDYYGRDVWARLLYGSRTTLIVVLGAQLAVEAATAIAVKIGISDRIIGLTVVAIGTSLPELVTCVVAASKGNTDIAVGDIVGSCIFNVLRTLGIAATIAPLTFAPAFLIDSAIALGAAVLWSVLGWIKGHKIKRWGGIVMLLGFAAYYVYLFAI